MSDWIRDNHFLLSDPGTSWVKDTTVAIDIDERDYRALTPNVVALPEGGWRMYLQGTSADDCSVILSAVSEDGLAWTREPGIRVAHEHANLGSPRCLPLPGGGCRLYYHEYARDSHPGPDAGQHIVSAVSTDGLSFECEPGVRIRQHGPQQAVAVYAPEILRLADGRCRIYYEANDSDRNWRIMSATSTEDP